MPGGICRCRSKDFISRRLGHLDHSFSSRPPGLRQGLGFRVMTENSNKRSDSSGNKRNGQVAARAATRVWTPRLQSGECVRDVSCMGYERRLDKGD